MAPKPYVPGTLLKMLRQGDMAMLDAWSVVEQHEAQGRYLAHVNLAFKEDAGKGTITMLRWLADNLAISEGNEVTVTSLATGGEPLTGRLKAHVVEPVKGQYNNPHIVLVDRNTRKMLSLRVGDWVEVQARPAENGVSTEEAPT